MSPSVVTGLDRLAADCRHLIENCRVGLIANPTSVDRELRHAADLLAEMPGLELVALFGPEHGIRGDAQYMVAVGQEPDPRTGVTVHSLYGADEASLTPTPESLEGLDALIFDIQDVGARYYTYVWTMVLAMRACAGRGIRFIVLDRPNPIAGTVEGGVIHPGFGSFVGLCSVPNRHGLTAGELARLIADREQLDLELQVVQMQGWRRSMFYDETGLPWVMPSPNMPTLDTALVYPGLCLLEGTEISEGRGTTRPFELLGAPYIDGDRLARALALMGLPGAAFRPAAFRPTWEKHAGARCGGVQIHVTERASFRPYRTGVAIISAIHDLYPDDFLWREHAYEFVEDVPAIDLLAGSSALRDAVDRGASFADLTAQWKDEESEFRDGLSDVVLYE